MYHLKQHVAIEIACPIKISRTILFQKFVPKKGCHEQQSVIHSKYVYAALYINDEYILYSLSLSYAFPGWYDVKSSFCLLNDLLFFSLFDSV